MSESTSYLAIWGAALSTMLAAIKIWEIWRARRRIEFSYNFTGLPTVGNEVIVRNLSGTPLIISYWELVWLKKKWFGAMIQKVRSIVPDHDISDIFIASHSSTKLSFAEERYFDWSQKSLAGAAIYLRIQIAGESKPRVVRIYG